MSTKTRPEGGALTLILDQVISNIQSEVASESDLPFHVSEFSKQLKRKYMK